MLKEIVNLDRAVIYGDYIFSDCCSIENVVLNSNATHIGIGIVDECSKLLTFSFPILDFHFNCEYLAEDIIGNNSSEFKIIVTNGNIPANFFNGCKKEIDILNHPELIYENAFMNTSKVNIDLSNTIKIKENAFYGCIINGDINLELCKYIGDFAFENCRNIERVKLNPKLEYFGVNSFNNVKLKELIMPYKGNKYSVVDNYLFEDKSLIYYAPCSINEYVKLDKKIETIKSNAFNNVANLKSIILTSVKIIENNAFNNCKQLNSVNIENILETAQRPIFNGCDNLSVLTLNEIAQGGLRHIGDYFDSNVQMKKIVPIKKLIINGNKLNNDDLCILNEINEINIKGNILEIPAEYFKKCKELIRIDFSSSVRSLGYRSFAGCVKLKDVNFIYNQVEEYSDECFENTAIQDFCFSKATKLIGKNIFLNTNIAKITFENEMRQFNPKYYGIGFQLKSISFKEASLINNAFENLINLESIKIDKIIDKKIPVNCFKNCHKLEEILITSFNNIEYSAFYNCSSILSMVIPDECVVSQNAFYGCDNISRIEFKNTVTDFNLRKYGFNPNSSKISTLILNEVTFSVGALAEFD